MLGKVGFDEQADGGITTLLSDCSDWIAARCVPSLFFSVVRLCSVDCRSCTSDAVKARRFLRSNTSALTGGAVVWPSNRASNALAGFFSGSTGVPFQNSI